LRTIACRYDETIIGREKIAGTCRYPKTIAMNYDRLESYDLLLEKTSKKRKDRAKYSLCH